MMSIYLLTQDTCKGYDTFSSCVVIAPSVEMAIRIHPSGGAVLLRGRWVYADPNEIPSIDDRDPCTYASMPDSHSWPSDTKDIYVTEIGFTTSHRNIGVVCSSYTAG